MTCPRPDVRLRPLRAGDAATIAGWAVDPEFVRAADWSAERSIADHERFHARLIAEPPSSLVRLGLEHGGDLVGYVDLHGAEPTQRELGFVVGGRERWGRGLGLAAASGGLDHAFGVLGLREVTAEVEPGNLRSLRILLGLGMRESAAPDADGHRCFRLAAGEWPRTSRAGTRGTQPGTGSGDGSSHGRDALADGRRTT